MIETIKTIIGTVCLGYLSVADIRRRELATAPILVMGLLGIGFSLAGGMWREPAILLQLVPGLLVLLIARISRESIGYGDGLVILCMGFYLSLAQLLELCMLALMLAGLAALVLLVVLRRGRRETLPFVPFLLAGYAITMLGGT